MNWIFFSVFTAMLWGLCYTAVEQVVKTIDKSTYIALNCLVTFFVCAFIGRDHLIQDISKMQQNHSSFWWFALAVISSIVGVYMSIFAIETSNASLAASLEITYPFWCILLAWLFFGTTMSITSMIGVLVVFVGVIIIIKGT